MSFYILIIIPSFRGKSTRVLCFFTEKLQAKAAGKKDEKNWIYPLIFFGRCAIISKSPWRGILMVRSHIGNVVCRKALCVRVASSPPERVWIQFVFGLFVFNLIIMLKWEMLIQYSNENKLHLFFIFGNQRVTVRCLIFYSWLCQKYLLVILLGWLTMISDFLREEIFMKNVVSFFIFLWNISYSCFISHFMV